MTMNERRHLQVSQIMTEYSIRSVIELGCSEGEFVNRASLHDSVDLVVGVDIDDETITRASHKVYPHDQQKAIQWRRKHDQDVWLFQGDALVKYPQLKHFGTQLIAMIDVIEHLQKEMIPPAMENVMGYLRPEYFFVSTPNYEFNVHFSSEPRFRHSDHKFEWTRDEFAEFYKTYAAKYGY